MEVNGMFSNVRLVHLSPLQFPSHPQKKTPLFRDIFSCLFDIPIVHAWDSSQRFGTSKKSTFAILVFVPFDLLPVMYLVSRKYCLSKRTSWKKLAFLLLFWEQKKTPSTIDREANKQTDFFRNLPTREKSARARFSQWSRNIPFG